MGDGFIYSVISVHIDFEQQTLTTAHLPPGQLAVFQLEGLFVYCSMLSQKKTFSFNFRNINSASGYSLQQRVQRAAKRV